MPKIFYKAGIFGGRDQRYFFKKDSYFQGLTLFVQELIKDLSNLKLKEDIEIHFDSQFSISKRPKYLILLEHKYIRPQNYLIFSKRYRKIFGWDMQLKDKSNFVYLRYPHFWNCNYENQNRNITYSMVCSNRNILFGPPSRSLYNERQKIIEFCEKNQEIDFHLYGNSWNFKNASPGVLSRFLVEMQKKGLISLKRKNKLKNYKGVIDNKNNILKSSKFNFCFENLMGYEGYVSEKIWDAISALSIPIYWPSWKIPEDYLPSNCYIDASKFKSIHELFEFTENISEEELSHRRKLLLKLAISKQKEMSIKTYKNLITNHIQKNINN